MNQPCLQDKLCFCLFLSFIERVIYDIESYDTTTVRASMGNWLISKYIAENSNCKVVFNGDGSDEVCGGYMYFHLAPDSIEFDKECRKLLNNIHYFDVLRSDRSISSHGLEARTPFLDKSFVETYLSINPNMRNHVFMGKCEKYVSLSYHTLKLMCFPICNSHDLCQYQTGCDQRVEMLPNIECRWLGRLQINFRLIG